MAEGDVVSGRIGAARQFRYSPKCGLCSKVGEWSKERPGTHLSQSSRYAGQVRWTGGKTEPDHLPLIVRCRACLEMAS